MKFKVERKTICAAVKRAARVSATISALPALRCVKIEAVKDTVIISGYNMETGVINTVSADVAEPGVALVNAAILSQILNKVEGDEIAFNATETAVRLSCEGSRFALPIDAQGEEFPELPTEKGEDSIRANCADLADGLDGVLFNVAPSATLRPILKGVNIAVSGGFMNLAASDSSRLANRAVRIVGKDSPARVVDATVLKEVAQVCRRQTGEVELSINDTHLRVEIADADGNVIVYVGRRLEGKFPTLNMTPKTSVEALVKSSELLACAQRCDVVATPDKLCKVELRFYPDWIDLQSQTEIGTVKDRCSAACWVTNNDLVRDEPLATVAFKCQYLVELLKHCDSEFTKIAYTGLEAPIFLSPNYKDEKEAEAAQSSYLYLLAPVRIKKGV